MNIAVILSAGTGSRFGSNIPKQFINLAGKNIIEYTIASFEQNDNIDEICIVADLIYHEKLLKISKENNFKKVKRIIQGGSERKDSSYNAIKEYQNIENVNLMFHDAVRPFVSQRIINETIIALEKYNAVDVAIPSADTIIQVDNGSKTIEDIPQRSKLQRGQTPQAFKLEVIQKAHELSIEDKNEPMFTDDCGLVKQYLQDEKIFVVSGEEKNIKITYPEDLLFAEKLIQLYTFEPQKSLMKYDSLKEKVIIVYGGHSGIGKEIINICQQYGAFCFAFSRFNNVDIRSINDIKKSLEDVFQSHHKIDHIINCAAILKKQSLLDTTTEEVEEQIGVNFHGSINISRLCYPYLKQTQGSLTLFTSSSYTRGRALYSLYSATKAAIVNFTQAIAQEWQKDKIRVNAINPARTNTPMRIKNFGIEPEETLLSSYTVAHKTIQIFLSNYSGIVVDVKKDID